MKRLMIALSAVVLIAAACGGSDSESAGDVLAELGLSEGEMACFTQSFDDLGLDMDSILGSDPDDLSASDRQAVIDVAADCAAAAAIEEAVEADANDEGDADTDEPAETTTSTTLAPETTTTTTTEAPGDESERRSYDDLSVFEQGFVDGFTQSGGTVEAGICILDEFEAAGIDIVDISELTTGDPTPEMMTAVFACGDELADSGIFDGGGISEEGDTYGDNTTLDLLWDQCTAGEMPSCDELYWTSAIGSGYETFGSTCGERLPETFGRCDAEVNGASVAGGSYGDDPVLDELWDACEAGDLSACDTLWFDSPISSEYEAFGNTCGGLETSPQFGTCNSSDPASYGDDAELDELQDSCTAGDLDACDELYLFSPVGSDYEAFGNSCGERSAEELFGNCAAELS